MKKVLITGANRSIGLETARQFLQKGFYVYMGSRTLENGREAIEQLSSEGLTNAEVIELDVADEKSVRAAREIIGEKTGVIDILINNAGILGGPEQPATTTSPGVYKEVFDTNLFGVIQMNQAFMDLVLKSEEPRIVNITSGLGSLTLHTDPSWVYYQAKLAAYSLSKAALNMYTIFMAYEHRETALKINAVDPGFTATDFNAHHGTGSVRDAAARIVKYATIGNDGPSGTFFSDDNNPETGISPW